MNVEILESEFLELQESLLESWEIEEYSKYLKKEAFDLENWTFYKDGKVSNVKKLCSDVSYKGYTIENRSAVKYFLNNLQNMLITKHKAIQAHLENMFFVKEDSAQKFAVLKNSVVHIIEENKKLTKDLEDCQFEKRELLLILKNFKEDYRDEKIEELKDLLGHEEKVEIKKPKKKSEL